MVAVLERAQVPDAFTAAFHDSGVKPLRPFPNTKRVAENKLRYGSDALAQLEGHISYRTFQEVNRLGINTIYEASRELSRLRFHSGSPDTPFGVIHGLNTLNQALRQSADLFIA